MVVTALVAVPVPRVYVSVTSLVLVDVTTLALGSESAPVLVLEGPEPPVVRGIGGRVILDEEATPEDDGTATDDEEGPGCEDEATGEDGIAGVEDEGTTGEDDGTAVEEDAVLTGETLPTELELKPLG